MVSTIISCTATLHQINHEYITTSAPQRDFAKVAGLDTAQHSGLHRRKHRANKLALHICQV
jgi:hypothetical protein